MAAPTYTATSESVCEGHPDKVADLIADTILDALLAQDPASRAAVEVLCKGNLVVLAGEVTTAARVDYTQLVREVVRQIGYTDPAEPFSADGLHILQAISAQAVDIARGITDGPDQGAGDQGTVVGYATAETPELMPLPILLAHRLARTLADDRKARLVPWLRPDGKTQLSVRYEGGEPVAVTGVLVSAQHYEEASQEEIRSYVRDSLLPRALGGWHHPGIRLQVNPTGRFAQGGPSADCGLTGRKIIVDSYGGVARHGGGAFSGKDPSKVDRSGAYFARYAARRAVQAGLASRVELHLSYAIGVAEPTGLRADCFGTGDEREVEAFLREGFDFRPGAIIQRLGLSRPIYRATTNYGHFGKADLPWEQ